ncbi:DUF805 domain-containing protein [Brachybacterium sp. MASK1Z-5]|uniref:DUF805 domain-containing protein n=1 Tax=Brachybacterium halotolerans TaxID=2795215 RepID=A0ABS1BDC8_9MICO|nr:DUF805 domain-containing protein [Brachybacterium halotolerans]MBK0332653.1 DUF805 domain-containing protein [Brachybacterium halotolerans]
MPRRPSLPPLRGATPLQALDRFFRQYGIFSGRASRSEYWWWVLVNLLVTGALQIAGNMLVTGWRWDFTFVIVGSRWPMGSSGASVIGVIATVWVLGTLIPSFAVVWRRLHDAGHGGGWFFLILIPIVGWLLLVWLLASKENPDGARFDRPTAATGPDAPLGLRSDAWSRS